MFYIILIILIILIFLIIYYNMCDNVYNGVENTYIFSSDILDNKILLLNELNIASDNASKRITNTLNTKLNTNTNTKKNMERFVAIDNRILTLNDILKQQLSLKAIQHALDNKYKTIIDDIQPAIIETKNNTNINTQKLRDMLSNIYLINYINFTNKQNAEGYKVYLQYSKPYENNKYYKQYLQ